MIKRLWEKINAFLHPLPRGVGSFPVSVLVEGFSSYRKALEIPAVLRAVNLISSSVAQLPLHVYRKGPYRTRVYNHPYIQVLNNPSSGLSRYHFIRTLTAHTLLTGNGYAWYTEVKGVPQFVILDPLRVVPVIEKDELFWEAAIEGTQIRFPDDEVLHIKGLSLDGVVGEPVYKLFTDTFAVASDFQNCRNRFYRNAALTSGHLVISRSITEEERIQIIQTFKSIVFGNREHWGLPALREGVQWQASPIQLSNVDFEKHQLVIIRDIANLFGIPPHLLGDPARTSYASLEQENQHFIQFTLEPWLQAWESELNLKFSPRGAYWEFVRNALVRNLLSERVEAYSKLFHIGVLSPNEIRARENMPPRESGDQFYVPANLTPTVTDIPGEEEIDEQETNTQTTSESEKQSEA